MATVKTEFNRGMVLGQSITMPQTNLSRRHGEGVGGIAQTVKAFIVGIILYFVAVAIVYTIGGTNIINNSQINTQIKNVAFYMAVLGTIIGLVAGTMFVLKLLGGL